MNMMKKVLLGLAAAFAFLAPQLALANTTDITVLKIVKSGLTNSATTAVAGDTVTFTNDGHTLINIRKSSAGSCLVTVRAQQTVQGLAVADQTFTVPASTGDMFAGPFPPSLFNDANGKVNFITSDENGLTFSVLRL